MNQILRLPNLEVVNLGPHFRAIGFGPRVRSERAQSNFFALERQEKCPNISANRSNTSFLERATGT